MARPGRGDETEERQGLRQGGETEKEQRDPSGSGKGNRGTWQEKVWTEETCKDLSPIPGGSGGFTLLMQPPPPCPPGRDPAAVDTREPTETLL